MRCATCTASSDLESVAGSGRAVISREGLGIEPVRSELKITNTDRLVKFYPDKKYMSKQE